MEIVVAVRAEICFKQGRLCISATVFGMTVYAADPFAAVRLGYRRREVLRLMTGEAFIAFADRDTMAFGTRATGPSTPSLPAASLEDGLMIKSVYSDDDSLEAVFKYLVNG